MGVRITGLEEFRRQFETISKATQALDGTIATLEFDPTDRSSVERAISNMEMAIDRRIGPYRGNQTVASLAKEFKRRYRQEIESRVRAARDLSS